MLTKYGVEYPGTTTVSVKPGEIQIVSGAVNSYAPMLFS